MSTVFPVAALKADGETSEIARPEFFGTAFAIGLGAFVAALHVVQSAETHGELAIAYLARIVEPGFHKGHPKFVATLWLNLWLPVRQVRPG